MALTAAEPKPDQRTVRWRESKSGHPEHRCREGQGARLTYRPLQRVDEASDV